MQMNEQVLTTLEVLRNFAENDFELHRIDVLEKDLTDPPKVEVIDEKHQKFNGVIYHKNSSGHFAKGAALHRAVYSYYFGEIPEGLEIHHKNQNINPSDNAISNLQPLTKSNHRRLHNLRAVGQAKVFEKICPICGKKFLAKNKNKKCCSRDCANIGIGRHFLKEPIKKVCPVCGKKFLTKKKNQVTCSKSCATKLRWISREKEGIPDKIKKCEFCGKEFLANKKTQRFCGYSCSNRFTAPKNKKK